MHTASLRTVERSSQHLHLTEALLVLLCLASGAAGALTLTVAALAVPPLPPGAVQGMSATLGLTDILNGAWARSLGIVSVISLGLVALAGYMERTKAASTVLGVGVVFSAAALVGTLFPG